MRKDGLHSVLFLVFLLEISEKGTNMYTQCKYVVLAQSKDGIVKENIYIFPAIVVHKTVASRMKGIVVGAGFIAKDSDGKLFCRGGSSSLGVKARKEDNMLLRSLFI